MTSLDVVIPTYNRPDLLARTLESLALAEWPSDAQIGVIVVDNNSRPDLSAQNRTLCEESSIAARVACIVETQQGRSAALNAGVAHSCAKFIGFIDDDERVHPRWLQVAWEYVLADTVDYVGGPCLPDWEDVPPPWLPVHCGKYVGVIGWIEQGEVLRSFDSFGGTLCGGNSVIRRLAIEEIGGFRTKLGRSQNDLMGGEDEALHRALKATGKSGVYDPRLAILHYVPKARMTRRYHLRWAFWSGVSNGVRSRWESPEPVRYLLGVPRYRVGLAARGAASYLVGMIGRKPASQSQRFAGLMDGAYVAGMVYGRYWHRRPR